jgi:hypothetical protein
MHRLEEKLQELPGKDAKINITGSPEAELFISIHKVEHVQSCENSLADMTAFFRLVN